MYSSGGVNIDLRLEDLESVEKVIGKIQRLDAIKDRASRSEEVGQPIGWGNLYGLI